jgi:hypothetical protein
MSLTSHTGARENFPTVFKRLGGHSVVIGAASQADKQLQPQGEVILTLHCKGVHLIRLALQSSAKRGSYGNNKTCLKKEL